MLAAHAEGLDGRRRLLRQQQRLLQLDLLLQFDQHGRLHTVPAKNNSKWNGAPFALEVRRGEANVLGDDAADLQQAEADLPWLLVQHWDREATTLISRVLGSGGVSIFGAWGRGKRDIVSSK